MSENATDPAPATAVRSVSPVAGPQARSAAVATTDFRWYPRLTRGSDGSVVAGVCVGLADHLGVRVVHVRLVMVLLATLSGAGVALYSALWALTPTGPASAGAGR
ncbi:PspC domain-containing protein, partial [Dietzia schimae]